MMLSWLFDAFLDWQNFPGGSLAGEVFNPSFHTLSSRLITILPIGLLLLYAHYLTRERESLAEDLHRAMVDSQTQKVKAEGVLAAIGDGVSIQDTDFKIIYQNEVHKSLVGGDFTGKQCYKAYNCRDEVCPDCPIAVCYRDGTIHKTQKRISLPLKEIYVEITASPLRDERGRIIAGIELLRDISESKQAEEQLRNSEMRFRNLVESTCDWVWEVDEKGVYTYSSPQVSELLGYDPVEVKGKTPFDFMPPEEAERIGALFKEFSDAKRPIYALENINLHKDGHPVVLETSGVPILDNAGALCGYRGMDRDISERKRAETNIRNLNESLAQRAAQLVLANKELESFSSSVSHDLRAPLTRIYSSGQLLREEYGPALGEEGLHLARTICDGCESMDELIEALLSLSRVTIIELHSAPCNLSTIAEMIVTDLRLSEPSRQVRFSIEEGLADDADARLIKVLLENLLGNSWKYTEKTVDARIEFGVTPMEGNRVYFVRDNGAGFAMEQADKLFKPFQRLHDAADFKGTGIGLATVHRIVGRHGGRVWCEGEPGRGATFYFTLK